jgi:phosphohistidine phosphatase
MRLYLVQHGQAKSEQEDPDRPLTDRGATDVRAVARRAADAGSVTVERVVHSGKTRARQTADVWGEVLGLRIEESDGLAPKDDPEIWASRVGAGTANLMLVGHLPQLARLAGLLLTGDADTSVVDFQPGGLVGLRLVDREQGPARWSVWLALPPAAA